MYGYVHIYLFLFIQIQFFYFLASYFIDLATVTLNLQNFINQKIKSSKPIRVIYVAGLDLFNRCNGLFGLRKSGMGGVAVVYRYGENKSLIKSILDQNSSKLYFISLDDENQLNDISSTLIRQKLQFNEDCSHLTYKSVLEHLQMTSIQKNK